MIGGSYGGADPVRRRHAGQARRRDRPDHHLERPVLLARAEQLERLARRDLQDPGRREEGVGRPVLRRRHHRRRAGRHGRTPRSTCRRARTSPTQACTGAVELNSQGYPSDGTLSSRGMPRSRRT